MKGRTVLALAATLAGAATGLAAQNNAGAPRDTTPPGAVYGVTEFQEAREKLESMLRPEAFTVYIIADMEGLAAAVRNGTEMRPAWRGGSEEHERFRQELTDEVNAVIEGARRAGATEFVVNDGHGGTLFRNVLPASLDTAALLIRGYPKPIVMSTGMNPRVEAMMIVGAHANAGTPGVISHSFAFDSFTVNGKVLNEAGIAAFIGGEMGVPLVLASGDDILTSETVAMLGPIDTVTTKVAYSRSSAASWSPGRVVARLAAAAERAVQRTRAGELHPLRLKAPYDVRFCLRRSYDAWVRETVGRLEGVEVTGERCYRYRTRSAEAVGNLLNEVEWTVLKD